MRFLPYLVGCLLLSGCASGKAWWPFSMFGRSEARTVDRATTKAAETDGAAALKREQLLRAAQSEAHKTDLALVTAPDARPVALARTSSAAAVSALDQAIGPLTVEETVKLRQLIADLLSENENVRIAAETRQANDAAQLALTSRELQQARADRDAASLALADAQASLRVAFDRENALAAKQRQQAFWFGLLKWVGGIAVVGFIGLALYFKLQLSGIGRALGSAKAAGHNIDPIITQMDANTSKLGQSIVGKARAMEQKAEE